VARCEHCEQEFADTEEFRNHFDPIKIIWRDPLVLLLNLPDGCTDGRVEAATAFAKVISGVRQRYPNKEFQYIPFDREIGSFGGTTALLAIEK
jgi:hypothetical protein